MTIFQVMSILILSDDKWYLAINGNKAVYTEMWNGPDSGSGRISSINGHL